MSSEATAWVIRVAMRHVPPHLVPTLLLYADSADIYGRNAGAEYTLSIIADHTGVSDSQAKRNRQSLVRLRYLERGDQFYASIRRPDRRRVIYDIPGVRDRDLYPWALAPIAVR